MIGSLAGAGRFHPTPIRAQPGTPAAPCPLTLLVLVAQVTQVTLVVFVAQQQTPALLSVAVQKFFFQYGGNNNITICILYCYIVIAPILKEKYLYCTLYSIKSRYTWARSCGSFFPEVQLHFLVDHQSDYMVPTRQHPFDHPPYAKPTPPLMIR